MARPQAICVGCNKKPNELPEYSDAMTESGLSNDDYVWKEEGTLNMTNGHFLCTPCYIKAGMPSARFGRWFAP